MSISPENKSIAEFLCSEYEKSIQNYYPYIGNDRALGNFDENMWETEKHIQRLEKLRDGFCNVKTDEEFRELVFEADQTF